MGPIKAWVKSQHAYPCAVGYRMLGIFSMALSLCRGFERLDDHLSRTIILNSHILVSTWLIYSSVYCRPSLIPSTVPFQAHLSSLRLYTVAPPRLHQPVIQSSCLVGQYSCIVESPSLCPSYWQTILLHLSRISTLGELFSISILRHWR